jgi:acetyl-CoA carboxylase alpha subunit
MLKRNLDELALIPKDRLLSERHQKLMSYGVFEEAIA